MVRRFPSIPETSLGYEGTPFHMLMFGIGFLVVASMATRYITADNSMERTKRHHPKGIGYTSINKQKDKLHNMITKISPNLDETYYEYSSRNPRPKHRRNC